MTFGMTTTKAALLGFLSLKVYCLLLLSLRMAKLKIRICPDIVRTKKPKNHTQDMFKNNLDLGLGLGLA